MSFVPVASDWSCNSKREDQTEEGGSPEENVSVYVSLMRNGDRGGNSLILQFIAVYTLGILPVYRRLSTSLASAQAKETSVAPSSLLRLVLDLNKPLILPRVLPDVGVRSDAGDGTL